VTSSRDSPAVAADDEGDFIVVVWVSGGQDGNSTGIFAQRFDVPPTIDAVSGSPARH
jgi:hypothetical protein